MSRRVGEVAFSKVEKCNSELFTLTYGAIVMQLLKDYEEVDATNEQLEKMCALVAPFTFCAHFVHLWLVPLSRRPHAAAAQGL